MAQLMKYTEAQWAAMEAKRAAREKRELDTRTTVAELMYKLAGYFGDELVDVFQHTSDKKGRTYRIVDICVDEKGVHLVVEGLGKILEGR